MVIAKPLVQINERTSPEGNLVANRILLAIPHSEYHLVRPLLEYVTLTRKDRLHEPNKKSQFVYFPNCGLLSLVVVTKDGKTVEAGITGKEGIVGLGSAVGLTRNPLREVVQISGDGFRVSVNALQKLLQSAPTFQTRLSRYAVLYGLQVSQTAACNRLHDAEQRLSRWLLMTQDRIDSSVLRITHDFLATMLGTDRPTISLAAANLKRKHIIRYARGSVEILNRGKLENTACECYSVVRQFNDELSLK